MTELDPSYKDTPSAGKTSVRDYQDFYHVDGDGDQVPELKIKFSTIRHKQPKRIGVEIVQNAVGKPGKPVPPIKFEWDFPKELDAGTGPLDIQVTDGNRPTTFKFIAFYPEYKWNLELFSEGEQDDLSVYNLVVWLPWRNGSLVRELQQFQNERFSLPKGRTAVHNVFRPDDLRKINPEFWALETAIGAYGDRFRITFLKPTPGDDTVEIGITGLADNEPALYTAPIRFKWPRALQLKVVGTAGARLDLDLDGDGITDLEVFDQLKEEANQRLSIQLPNVSRFRQHEITIGARLRSPVTLPQTTVRFDIVDGLFQNAYNLGGGGDLLQTAASSDASKALPEQVASGSFEGQILYVEMLRMQARSQAASDKIIRPETHKAWEKLSGAIIAGAIGGEPAKESDRKIAASDAAKSMLDELLKEPGLKGAFEFSSMADSMDGQPSMAMHSDNPYTGEMKTTMLGFETHRTVATLKQVAAVAREGKWNWAYQLYDRASGQLDAWVAHQLRQSKRDDEAKRLETALKLGEVLDRVGKKPNPQRIQAVFYPSEEFKQHGLQSVPLLLYYYIEDKKWKLFDVTRPDDSFGNRVAYGGEKFPPHALFLEMNTANHFPKGYILYQVPDGPSGRVECTEPLTVSAVAAYIAGALAIAGLLLLTAGAASILVTAFFVGSAVAGVVSAGAHMVEQAQEGNLTPGEVALDVIQIIGAITGASAAVAAEVKGAQAAVKALGPKASPLLQRLAGWESLQANFVPLTATAAAADTIQFLHFAAHVPAGLTGIDNSQLPAEEKFRAKLIFLSQAAAMGAMTVLAVRGVGGHLGGKSPKLRFDVVDGAPVARLAFPASLAEYEEALAKVMSQESKQVLGKVPIEVVDAARMKVVSGSPSSDAVVRIEGGQPKLYVLEGTPPSRVARETPHLDQVADAKKAGKGAMNKMASLDESVLAEWPKFGAAKRLELTKNKLFFEIDAQRRIIRNIDAEITAGLKNGSLKAGSPEANRLFQEADDAWQNLEHLLNKDTALVGLERELQRTKAISDESLISDVPRLMNKPTTTGDSGFDLEMNWRTLSEDDFLAAYRAKYPPEKSGLSDADLRLRYQQGKRLNPDTWHLKNKDGRKEVIVPESHKAKFTEQEDAAIKPGESEFPLPFKEQQEWNQLLASRESARKTRAKLEATGDESEALRSARYDLNEASRKIGEFAAVRHVKGRPGWADAELVYGGQTSRSGDFDLVFRRFNSSKNRYEYLIVEAKGGSGKLGHRMVEAEPWQQGTKPYYESVRDNMANGTKPAVEPAKPPFSMATTGELLQKAKADDVTYLLVKVPFQSSEGSVVAAIKVNTFKF